MGLTVAETFILLVFTTLLILLLIYRQIANEESLRDPDVERVQVIVGKMPTAEKQAAIAFLDQTDLSAKIIDFYNYQNREPKPLPDPDVERVQVIVGKMPTAEKQAAIAFLDQTDLSTKIIDFYNYQNREPEPPLAPEIESILESLEEVPSEQLQEIVDFVAQENLSGRLEELRVFDKLTESISGRSLSRKLVTMNPLRRSNLDEWIETEEFQAALRNRNELSELIRLHESKSLVSAAVAQDIRDEVGGIVTKYGGKIGPDGVISLPADISFATNEATLTTEFKSFLQTFCPRLLLSLHEHEHSDQIQDVRVGGHSSSEWLNSTSQQEKFLNNLDLSQRRAFAVSSYCLQLLDDPDLIAWATETMTSVGFSSARPIFNPDQTENRELSRRVEFSYIVRYEKPN